MQPENQQNQQNQQPAQFSGQPYQVPEYLHLDPVTGQERGPRFSRKLLVIIALAVLIIAGSVYGYFWWQQRSTPQTLFYQAIDNSLQVQYVSRHFDIQTSHATNVINASTDLSDPVNPKSSLSVVSSTNKGKTNHDIQILNRKEYLLFIRSADPATIVDGLTKNQWYRQPSDFNSPVDFYISETDPLSLFNMAQGIIVMGNFTSAQRSDLINYIKTNDVYHITSIESGGDKNSYKYTVQLDDTKINGLNAEVAKLLKTDQHLTIHSSSIRYQQMAFWVDSAGMITKITYNGGDDKNNISTKRTITYAYPKSLSTATPTSVKELP